MTRVELSLHDAVFIDNERIYVVGDRGRYLLRLDG
jgi:hypothetical protein